MLHQNIFFCSTLSEFENFLLCDKCHNLSKRNVNSFVCKLGLFLALVGL
jgi:hypothetical protein